MNAREKLKKIIIDRGLNYKEAAEQIGITPVHLSDIIRGEANAGSKAAPLIARWAKPETINLEELAGWK